MIDIFISFLFLLFLEIILGVDNIIFVALLSNQVPKKIRKAVRFFGLGFSLILRLIFLLFITILLKMVEPLFLVFDIPISYKSLVTLFGGLFLIAKSTSVLHQEVYKQGGVSSHKILEEKSKVVKFLPALSIIVQIIIIDFVFSLDSLLMAIGLTNNFYVIASAIIGSIIFMLMFANLVSDFIIKFPTLKILALTFILMIGVFLILEGVSIHINKGYIYFAMGFSLFVEFLNNVVRNRAKG